MLKALNCTSPWGLLCTSVVFWYLLQSERFLSQTKLRSAIFYYLVILKMGENPICALLL